MRRVPFLPLTCALILCSAPGPATAAKPAPIIAVDSVERVLRCQAPFWSRTRGKPSRGRLIGAVRLPEHPGVHLRKGKDRVAYGTDELVASIMYAADWLKERFPGSPDLTVGDLSRRRGGRFRPHLSHQNGRDVDVGYIPKDLEKLQGERGKQDRFIWVGPKDLDGEKTWSLIEGFIRTGWIQTIFIDRRLARVVKQAAIDAGNPVEEVEELFRRRFMHARGHRNHFHVRVKPRTLGCREARAMSEPWAAVAQRGRGSSAGGLAGP
jgi:murein endopeptidase